MKIHLLYIYVLIKCVLRVNNNFNAYGNRLKLSSIIEKYYFKCLFRSYFIFNRYITKYIFLSIAPNYVRVQSTNVINFKYFIYLCFVGRLGFIFVKP